MICQRCQTEIDPGEEQEHLGRLLCEDCYMDALSPAKGCDPWAVYSAKNLEQHTGGNMTLTPIQCEILEILKRTGGLEPPALLQELQGKAGICHPQAYGESPGGEAGGQGLSPALVAVRKAKAPPPELRPFMAVPGGSQQIGGKRHHGLPKHDRALRFTLFRVLPLPGQCGSRNPHHGFPAFGPAPGTIRLPGVPQRRRPARPYPHALPGLSLRRGQRRGFLLRLSGFSLRLPPSLYGLLRQSLA